MATEGEWQDFAANRCMSGTTCREKMSLHSILADGRYAVVRHEGHSESMGRWVDPVRCKTYHALYHQSILRGKDPYGDESLCQIEGRFTKAVAAELARVMEEHAQST